jgi:hypothetical protein
MNRALRVVSVSLGSSRRDHETQIELAGRRVTLARRGTDGDMARAARIFRDLDGQVDVFGLGGMDRYVYANQRQYEFRDARWLVSHARQTPVVDGSALKNTLERDVIRWIGERYFSWREKKVLLVSATDRFGMAASLHEYSAHVLFGDLIFGLGLRIPVYSWQRAQWLARLCLPLITKLPFHWVYPTGKKQESRVDKFAEYYAWSDVIAGDWHLINRYLPEKLRGKTIVTNTLTRQDIEDLRSRGATRVIATTPQIEGRSFGTNVIEAMILALSGAEKNSLTPQECAAWIARIGITPAVTELTGSFGHLSGRARGDQLE